MNTQIQNTFPRTLRPRSREASVNLAKKRTWFANNNVAYGFVNLEYLFSQRIVTVSVETVQTAIQESLAEYTRQVDEMLSLLVQRTLDYKKRFQLPSGETLQPLDADGNPKPTLPTGVYDVAFPIQGGGTAWGDNRVSRAKMTIGDANRFTWQKMMADADWMRRHMLAALFTNTTWTYTDEAYGDLTVQPLANGDSVVYTLRNGNPVTDNHYLAQANAIGNSDNPFPAIYTELDEHPSNTGPYVAYVASDLVTSITALANFVEVQDPTIIYGSGTTVLNVNVDVDMTSRGGPLVAFGDRLLGKVDGIYIVEWSSMPSGYMLIHASGANDVLGMREYPEPELQGFFPEFNSVDGNHQEYRMIRYAGFGVLNRVAAVVMRIGNGSYAIPSGYTAPLPV
jgi:hypothetical protein